MKLQCQPVAAQKISTLVRSPVIEPLHSHFGVFRQSAKSCEYWETQIINARIGPPKRPSVLE
jgi:hypothetical protein